MCANVCSICMEPCKLLACCQSGKYCFADIKLLGLTVRAVQLTLHLHIYSRSSFCLEHLEALHLHFPGVHPRLSLLHMHLLVLQAPVQEQKMLELSSTFTGWLVSTSRLRQLHTTTPSATIAMFQKVQG